MSYIVAERRNADMEVEVACVRNKIFMKEEWIKDATKRVKQLDDGSNGHLYESISIYISSVI